MIESKKNSVQIQETTTCGCAPNPDGHGYCETNSTICVCNFGWVGDDCSEPVNEIMSGVPVRNESVTKEEWKYYYINAEGSSAFSVTLKELNTTGFVEKKHSFHTFSFHFFCFFF